MKPQGSSSSYQEKHCAQHEKPGATDSANVAWACKPATVLAASRRPVAAAPQKCS